MRTPAFGLAAALPLLASCSTTPAIEAMVVDDLKLPRSSGTVRVAVVGKSADDQDNAQLPHDVLGGAIARSLESTGMFDGVATGSSADHVLEVVVHRLARDGMGAITITLVTAWTLRGRDGAALWQKTITGTGEAAFVESLNGYVRLRTAVGRAAQSMIRAGLTALGESRTARA